MADSQTKKFDCVIWGGYGWGNTGDEICLAAAVERARRDFGPNLAVLAHNPEYTAWLFPHVTVIRYVPPKNRKRDRWKKVFPGLGSLWSALNPSHSDPAGGAPDSAWATCLRQSRRMYLAGGGYLTDLFPLDFILPPIRQALTLKLSVITAPIGIGPFQSAAAADQVAGLLKQMTLQIRDETSLAFCQAQNVNATLAPDDAFDWLNGWPPPAAKTPVNGHARRIGVCIFSQHGQPANGRYADWWIDCLRRLRGRHPERTIEGFCFHSNLQFDFGEMVRLFGRAEIPLAGIRPPELDFRRATAAIHEFDLVISTRFHATVAANVFNLPNVAVASGDYYLAKMTAACRNQPNSLLIDPARQSPDILLNFCTRALEERPQVGANQQ